VFTQAYGVFHRAANGNVTLLTGSGSQAGSQDGPAGVARFYAPAGLACDASGGIYVADTGNHTVRYIDAQRNVRTVLGTPGVAGHRVDALPGELDSPRSLVLVPGGLVVGSRHGIVRAGF
jgi:DNA-binding beta-propeller fold protein YncE